MVDAAVSHPGSALAAAVRTRLAAALEHDVPVSATLAALVAVAPSAALDLLVEAETALTIAEISSLATAALGGLRDDASARARYAALVLRRFHADLSARTSAEIAGAMSTFEQSEDRAAFESVLRRFPTDATLLRLAVRDAQRRGSRVELDELLTRLGGADPTPATAAFAYRARDSQENVPPDLAARVAFVSSYTIDGLVPFVDLAARRHDLVTQAYVAPFNSWTRDVIDPTSGLRAFQPDITFLAVAIDDLVPELAGALGEDDLSAAADIALERVLAVADAYGTWAAGRPLVIHRFHSAFAGPLGILDGHASPSRSDWLAALNARLAAALRERSGCFTLDIVEAVSAAGATLADNPKLRHIAAMRLPPTALAAVAEAYVRFIVPARGRTRKCVVLDLDNTLWGGVVGEDGKDGIRLSETGQGSEFFEFQNFLRTLTARGMLLAINSKNNAEDALEAIRSHPAMLLRESSFSAIRINWQAKSDNMIEIARELNIGLDSLVFVDDNPDERERMHQMLPEVLTVEMPKDPARYRVTLEGLPELQTLAITVEDRERATQYRIEKLRTEARAATGDVDTYLRSLQIRVAICPATTATYARIAQLLAKTNQFNTTTRRYGLAEVEAFARDPSLRLWTLSSSDRFGDHGLVAFTLVRAKGSAWEIDSFLMSCRVIGYGIESALLAHVAEASRAAGASRLDAEFVETKKNVPARNLYARHGFEKVEDGPDAEWWSLARPQPLPFPAWIERTA